MIKQISSSIAKWIKNRPGDKIIYVPLAPALLEEYNAKRPKGPQPVLCYAPFKNIYFGHNGKAVTCCYNRMHLLGIYPQRSIRQIWFGEEAERLRKYILHNDLSLGCHICSNHFSAKNFDGLPAKMYDHVHSTKKNFPATMEFELVNTCNLECVMCSGEFSSSIRKNREKAPPVENVYDAAFIKQLEEFIPYLGETKFFGGEPFLVDIYYEIWESITRLNPACNISVQTNATVLNDKVKGLLERGRFGLNISLDSLEKKTYESIRVNTKFEAVMENIEYFRKYTEEKDTFFGISVCPMRQNWRELPTLVNFCNEMNAPVYFHTVWFPPQYALWNISAAALEKISETLENVNFPDATPVQRKNRNHYADTIKLFKSWVKEAKQREREKEQYLALNNKPVRGQKFFERIRDFVYRNANMTEEAKRKKTDFYFSKINGVVSRLPEDYPLDKALDKINDVRIEILAAELEANSEEKILRQALAFGTGINLETNLFSP